MQNHRRSAVNRLLRLTMRFGFMQIGEHQIERAVLALVFGYCPIQRGGAARQLGHLRRARLRSATT